MQLNLIKIFFFQGGSRPHVIFAKNEVRITVFDNGQQEKEVPTGSNFDNGQQEKELPTGFAADVEGNILQAM